MEEQQLPEEGLELQGTDGAEVIVYDYDDNDEVIGWHKEAA